MLVYFDIIATLSFVFCYVLFYLVFWLYLEFKEFLLLIVDISELNLPKTCNISFPNGKDDLMNFEVTIHPDEGYYL